MNDAKTKLGQVKPYSFDASGFKSQLKARLMQEYRAQYGVEEDFVAEKSENGSFFSFNKLIFTPIVAILVLAVFISYEYVTKPMTAYAYLKKVERLSKSLENGFKVSTVHTVDGYTLNVDVKKDKSGDINVSVRQDGDEVENFVMSDGVLYVKETFDLKQERAVELTSVLNSLMLAELSDPRSEWRDLMERDDVNLSEEEDGSVKISYEESLGGETFVNELYFRDYAPVKRVRVAKSEQVDLALETPLSLREIETIEYKEIVPTSEEVEKPVDYVVFVDNSEFNEKMTSFVETEVDDLVREYSALPEKEVYFVWGKQEVIPAQSATEIDVSTMTLRVVEPSVVESDAGIEVSPVFPTLPPVDLPERSLPPASSSFSSVEETEKKPDIEKRVDVVIPNTVRVPLVRDTYMEEVFYDLLEDDEKPSKQDGGLKEVVPTTAVEVVTPPVKDFSKIETPGMGTERKIDLESDVRDTEKVDLIDHSVPEPYMAEPMDDPLNGLEGTEKIGAKEEPSSAVVPTVTDLIKERETLQQDLANRRFQLRMDMETEKLNPVDRTARPDEPVDEFRKE